MTVERDDETINDTCWLACFDLLGFTQKVNAYAERRYARLTYAEPLDVSLSAGEDFEKRLTGIKEQVRCQFVNGLAYLAGEYPERVLEAVEKEVADKRRANKILYYARFSDTVILYMPDAPEDPRDSFETMDSAGCNVFSEIVNTAGPVRGALAYGKFYADTGRKIFAGPVLVDAYRYAERQDWIGYVLTKEAVGRLSQIGFPGLTKGHYIEWQVPVKVEKAVGADQGKVTTIEREPLFAFNIGSILSTRELHNMMKEAVNDAKEEAENKSKKAGNKPGEPPNTWRDCYRRYRRKYKNTLSLVKATQRSNTGKSRRVCDARQCSSQG
jgi:hypothetical protein